MAYDFCTLSQQVKLLFRATTCLKHHCRAKASKENSDKKKNENSDQKKATRNKQRQKSMTRRTASSLMKSTLYFIYQSCSTVSSNVSLAY